MAKGIPKNGINIGRFQKGGISPRKGVKLSEETKEKMRQAKLGKKVFFSEQHKNNLSLALKGKPKPHLKGKKRVFTDEWREKINATRRAKYADRTKLKKREDRKSQSYIDWLKAVRNRDQYQCKMSNKDCSGILECHHILSWREHPELRYDINNGILLCKFHHPRKYSEEKRLSPYFMNLISKT
jgi:hypothetical protein